MKKMRHAPCLSQCVVRFHATVALHATRVARPQAVVRSGQEEQENAYSENVVKEWRARTVMAAGGGAEVKKRYGQCRGRRQSSAVGIGGVCAEGYVAAR